MRRNKKYLAYADNGRDFIEFEFFSFYRANSKKNIDDAKNEYRKKHGYAPKIISTHLYEYY